VLAVAQFCHAAIGVVCRVQQLMSVCVCRAATSAMIANTSNTMHTAKPSVPNPLMPMLRDRVFHVTSTVWLAVPDQPTALVRAAAMPVMWWSMNQTISIASPQRATVQRISLKTIPETTAQAAATW